MKTELRNNKIKLDNIQEPENFYIMSNNDDFVLNSKEAVELLLKDLENVKYDKKLASFYSKLSNEIQDLTKK